MSTSNCTTTSNSNPIFVTVTLPDGPLRSYHLEDGLGGVGYEFAEAGILVLRFEDSDHMIERFRTNRLDLRQRHRTSDRGRRSASGR